MNFQPMGTTIPSWGNMNCINAPTTVDEDSPCVRGGNDGQFISNPHLDPDKTPFHQEIIRGADGHDYFHVIMGDLNANPDSDEYFVQEFFIRVLGNNGNNWVCGSNSVPCSWSAGALINGGYDIFPSFGNQADPLDPANIDGTWNNAGSGSGTARPDRVIFRQIVKDPNMFQETDKTSQPTKPRIVQIIAENFNIDSNGTFSGVDDVYTIADPSRVAIKSDFMFDMSELDIFDATSTGVMENKLTFYDPSIPESNANFFDVVEDGQNMHTTGGQYTYNLGALAGGMGDYTYSEGDFHLFSIDWHSFSSPDNVPNF